MDVGEAPAAAGTGCGVEEDEVEDDGVEPNDCCEEEACRRYSSRQTGRQNARIVHFFFFFLSFLSFFCGFVSSGLNDKSDKKVVIIRWY